MGLAVLELLPRKADGKNVRRTDHAIGGKTHFLGAAALYLQRDGDGVERRALGNSLFPQNFLLGKLRGI